MSRDPGRHPVLCGTRYGTRPETEEGVDPAFPQWCYMARPRGRGPAEGAAGEAIVQLHTP